MKTRIVYTLEVKSQIRKLPPSLKRGIRSAIDEIGVNVTIGKPLQDELEGLRSHRFKRYRVVYKLDEQSRFATVLYVGPRYNVYDLLKSRVHS